MNIKDVTAKLSIATIKTILPKSNTNKMYIMIPITGSYTNKALR